MKSRFLPAFAIALSFIFSLAFSGCGSSGPEQVLTVTPAGPTIVMKGDTLLLTANLTGVAWSVQGGDGNGSIDGNGLYTPPAQIPTASPRITVMAESNDGQVATALIDLRAGVDVTFGSPMQMNDTPTVGFPGILAGLIDTANADHFAVRLGSVQVDAVWPGLNTALNVFYAQSLDFAAFSPEENLVPDSANPSIPMSVETDSNENPGIIYRGVAGGAERIFFLGSDNQGVDFNPPVPIASSSPASNNQNSGYARIDNEDDIHLVFTEQDTTVINGATNVFYTRSEDGGSTWSSPEIVSAVADDTVDVLLPSLAVDPNGDRIYVCWNQLGIPGDLLFSFSTDGGNTFSTPAEIVDSDDASFCRVARGPTGEIYVSYSSGADTDEIFLQKSVDGGVTFGGPLAVSPGPANIDNIPSLMSVDSLGRVDVVWPSDPDASGTGWNLLYARSVNGGAAFSAPVPLVESSSNVFIATGLRHDSADRLYLQYWESSPTATNVFLIEGE